MTFIHGRAIRASEVESYCSRELTDEEFTALCNAISWGIHGEHATSMPSFTERVRAGDQGIDADWHELPTDTPITPLCGPGWNVHQYKRRDALSRDRSSLINSLASNAKSGVRQAVKKLYESTEKRPGKYVLFTNLDLTHANKNKLRTAILEGYDQPANVAVEIIGAAEIATLLVDLPNVRFAFFPYAPFSTWETAHAEEAARSDPVYGAQLPLIGRDKELADLRTLVDDASVRIVLISGAQDIGKTLLAFTATEHRKANTLYALDPLDLKPDLLKLVRNTTGETIVIIDDPDPRQLNRLTNEALVGNNLKLLVTLPSAEVVLPVPIGDSGSIRSVKIGPLNNENSRKLLEAANADFHPGTNDLVLAHADGNPGVLLLAAKLGPKLQGSLADFEGQIARDFENRLRANLGQEAVDALRLLSLLTAVGVKDAVAIEVNHIWRFFGQGLSETLVQDQLSRLESASYIRVRGRYAEVVPPLLANALCKTAVSGKLPQLAQLFAALPGGAPQRLLNRLQSIDTYETRQFWRLLVGPGGLVHDFASALKHSHMLEILASTLPDEVAPILFKGITELTLNERRDILGTPRRHLVDSLHELMLRLSTAANAMRAMALLAAAEKEDYSNNASGTFAASLYPLHPQLPLPLGERLAVISEALADNASPELQLVMIQAIGKYVKQELHLPYRQPTGSVPLVGQPDMTWADVWDYDEHLCDLLFEKATSPLEQVASSAVNALPEMAHTVSPAARPEKAVRVFAQLIDWATSHAVPVPVPELATQLYFTRGDFQRILNEGVSDDKLAQRITKAIVGLDELRTRLDTADFATRMERWAYSFTYEPDDDDDTSGLTSRRDHEVQRLAKEAIEDPGLVSGPIMVRLVNNEGAAASFWRALGQNDKDMKWLNLLQELAASDGSMTPFAHYTYGVAKNDPQLLQELLDTVTESRQISGAAIIAASSYLPADVRGVERVERLLGEERVAPVNVAHILGKGPWSRDLLPEEYLRFLSAIAGPNLEFAGDAVPCVSTWIYYKKPIEGDLAEFVWRCLETGPLLRHLEGYYYDHVAAHMAKTNHERGFAFFEYLCHRPVEDRGRAWYSLNTPTQHELWDTLQSMDPTRSLIIALTANQAPSHPIGIWRLPELINQTVTPSTILQVAGQSEALAELVASSITGDYPEFVLVAVDLLTLYPGNGKLRTILTTNATKQAGVRQRPHEPRLLQLREGIQHLNDGSISTNGKVWLRQLDQVLHQAILVERTEMEDSYADHLIDQGMGFSAEQAWMTSQALLLTGQAAQQNDNMPSASNHIQETSTRSERTNTSSDTERQQIEGNE